ncbi:helix-turn-helix transcriptional regulator [Nocardia farcinica]|uniref:helix-turn-helix transcriptional regulator n=1 Tax=Nocardia farcinica TaxID=37329 RepID=UPI001893F1C8|nr:helix-turn-helix domain-containing protein [Nocardia farcinica]MBF6233960.1 helix-turn-helix domain-containing protein [Nocardia farcinica]
MTSTTEWDRWEREMIDRVARGVRQAREAAGLSQRGLAEIAGVSQGAVANLESGTARVRQSPTIATLVRFAVALETPVAQLLYPDLPLGEVEIWPGTFMDSTAAADWLAGREVPATPSGASLDRAERIRLSHELRDLDRRIAALRLQLTVDAADHPERRDELQRAYHDGVGALRARRRALAGLMYERGWLAPEDDAIGLRRDSQGHA